MAKYIKTVDLWEPEVYAKLESGELKLQRGQWVFAGSDNRSRFHNVEIRDGRISHIRAFHYPCAAQKFQSYCS